MCRSFSRALFSALGASSSLCCLLCFASIGASAPLHLLVLLCLMCRLLLEFSFALSFALLLFCSFVSCVHALLFLSCFSLRTSTIRDFWLVLSPPRHLLSVSLPHPRALLLPFRCRRHLVTCCRCRCRTLVTCCRCCCCALARCYHRCIAVAASSRAVGVGCRCRIIRSLLSPLQCCRPSPAA